MRSISNKELVARLSPEPRKIHVSSFPFPAKLRWRVDRKYELGEEEAVFDPDAQGYLRPSLAGSIDVTPGPRGQLMNMVRVVDPVNDPPPFNLSLFKGIKSYRLPRWFVTFLLTHPVAKDFINWTRNTIHPEEHTVQTLARNISHLTFQLNYSSFLVVNSHSGNSINQLRQHFHFVYYLKQPKSPLESV